MLNRHGLTAAQERDRIKRIHLAEQADAERRRLKPPCLKCGTPTVCVGECRNCRGKSIAAAKAERETEHAALLEKLANSYMLKELLARGWHREQIDDLLGPPDFEHSYRASHWYGRCVEKRYMKDRVHEAERRKQVA
jgi:hypothetical protein